MEDNKNPFNENKGQEETPEQTVQEEENKEAKEEVNQENNEENKEEVTENPLEEKYNKLNDNYIRLAADFENFRKRTQTEKEELSSYTKIKVLKEITTALDTFDLAREHLKEIDDVVKVKESYEQAFKKLSEILTKVGLVEMEALGQKFNPNEHEAITQIPTDEFEPDTVAMIAQKGYKLEDKVVRPALVGVACEKN